MDIRASDGGVRYFLEWVQTRFMDVEVTKIAQMMNDLFRKCKRRGGQSVRDFNVEFERMVLRLHEVKCNLPPLIKAWLYLDKLRLSEHEELALLASVGNEYDVRRLQHAALVQDRNARRNSNEGWKGNNHHETGKGRWGRQTVHLTGLDDGSSGDDEDPLGGRHHESESDLMEENVAEAQHSAFMAYQGAKAKYKEAIKGRGTDPGELEKRASERLRLAKQRSYCSACKRRGHWHKDPECPLRGRSAAAASAPRDGVQQAQMCHTVNMVRTCLAAEGLSETHHSSEPAFQLAIVDTACSKSVAGYDWFEAFCNQSDLLGHSFEILDETEHFKFGASRVHRSAFSIWAWFGIAGKWVAVKIAIVHCKVPLLLSRPALAQLGMTFDVAQHQVNLKKLNVCEIPLKQSTTGHPALVVSDFPAGSPPILDAAAGDEVWVPAQEVYMACQSVGRETSLAVERPSETLFYPKKIPLEVENMLQTSPLPCSSFFAWWSHANQSRDFWIETENEMIRVHVVPRKFKFDPTKWSTKNVEQKSQLLACLEGQRISERMSCLSDGVFFEVEVDSINDGGAVEDRHDQWIGRSRFQKTARALPDFHKLADVQSAEPAGRHGRCIATSCGRSCTSAKCPSTLLGRCRSFERS